MKISASTANRPESETPRYGITRRLEMSYEQAVDKVTAALKEQGFGILTEIDIKATLKQKPDKDFTKYIIFAACNPPLAYRALSEEIDVGLLLPCNVTVFGDEQSGKTVVSAIDPEIMVDVTGRADLRPFALEVKEKLGVALEAL